MGVADDWLPVYVSGPELDEVQSALSLVMDSLVPADKGYILTRVLTLLSHYRQDQTPPQVERMIAEDWADDLGEFPSWVIDEAARWWRRNKVFKPSICEIRRLCAGYIEPEAKIRDRLVAIIENSRRRSALPRETEVVNLVSRSLKRVTCPQNRMPGL